MKCDVCEEEITELIMEKIKGTHIKNKGKKYNICNNCQKKYTKEEIIKKIK